MEPASTKTIITYHHFSRARRVTFDAYIETKASELDRFNCCASFGFPAFQMIQGTTQLQRPVPRRTRTTNCGHAETIGA